MSVPDLSRENWRKSTFSAETGDCVEVADGVPGVLPVRDSKDPSGPSLVFSADARVAFVAGVRAGEFEV
ncbi:regulatory protein [Streptomyces sp. NRRL S-495]|nr:regulatory protein [Streptomyces sp. NRRL S-495]